VNDVFELQVCLYCLSGCSLLPCFCFTRTCSFANYRTMCLQRNLNNAFAYDLVPSPSVLTAALKAARRVNDYPTAVRIFEGMLFAFAVPSSDRLRVEMRIWIRIRRCMGQLADDMDVNRNQGESREPWTVRSIP